MLLSCIGLDVVAQALSNRNLRYSKQSSGRSFDHPPLTGMVHTSDKCRDTAFELSCT